MNIYDQGYLIDGLKEAFDELKHLKKEVEDWRKAAANLECDSPKDLMVKYCHLKDPQQ